MQTETTIDGFLGERLRLRQPARGFRSGHDAVLLAASVGEAQRVCELGCGAGVVSLCVASRLSQAHITGIDNDEAILELARINATDSNLAERTQFIHADIEKSFNNLQLTANSFDEVIANPPYYKAGEQPTPPDPQKANAMIATPDTLEAWIKCAAALTAAKGHFTLIHHPPALPELLATLAPRFGEIQILPIHARAETPATRLIIRTRRDSRAPLALLPPFVLQNPDGSPTAEAEAVLRDGKSLAFRPTQG